MAVLTGNDFRALSWDMIKRAHHDRGDKEDFKSLFGISPNMAAVVWNICDFPPGTTGRHLLWALLFLKVYGTEMTLLTLIGGKVCRTTFRKWIWIVIEAIAAQAPSVVSRMRPPPPPYHRLLLTPPLLSLSLPLVRFDGTIAFVETKDGPAKSLLMELILKSVNRHLLS